MTDSLPAHVDFQAVVFALLADPETAPAVRAVIAEQARVEEESVADALALADAFQAEDAERARRRAAFHVV